MTEINKFGVIIACKSVHEERMKQNFEVFDFKLTDEDMRVIKKLYTGNSLFFNHQDPNMVKWFDDMVKTRRIQQDSSKEKKRKIGKEELLWQTL